MNKGLLKPQKSNSKDASDVYVVNNVSEKDAGITRLMELMANNELCFYKTDANLKFGNPQGLIAKDDVVIIKVNSQWEQRGGTNTDLLKLLIRAILDHPEGFSGEVIVADNGQAQHGSAQKGGSLTWVYNNARDTSQSVQKVADSFLPQKVSTCLWDTITETQVAEYSKGDLKDGYIVESVPQPGTGFLVSYPKFKSKFGTFISLKQGLWDAKSGKYNSGSLKLINLPVLKAHFIYGVTGCVKSYMGVVSDKLTTKLGASSHQKVALGCMGTEMAETRFPVLNILDATWVNAKPGTGPWTPYDAATWGDVILAGTDPAAIDIWAARHVLMTLAKEAGQNKLDSIDPDNKSGKSFGQWLTLAAAEINKAGYKAALDESQMNVFVSE
jgi:hypothetical protein